MKVPPGVDNGDRIRLAGEGEAGAEGGPTGDLYVQISVKEHEFFQRDGKTSIAKYPLDWWKPALAGKLKCRP